MLNIVSEPLTSNNALQVLSALTRCLGRLEAQRRLPPLLSEVLSADSRIAAPCQAACLEADLLTSLVAKLGPQTFLANVHPVLLRFLGSSHAEHRPSSLSQVRHTAAS